jgi:hypothetical protein
MYQAKLDDSDWDDLPEEDDEDSGEDSGEDETDDGFDYPFEDSDEWHDLHGFKTLVLEVGKKVQP